MKKIRQMLYSILHNRCPRCHKGKFWPHAPYRNLFFNGGRLFEYCTHCGLKYYREIGFWYGAMYVSYALSIALFLILWAATSLVLPSAWSLWIQVGVIIGILIVSAPVVYFVSRLIWVNLFVHYDIEKSLGKSVNAEPGMSDRT